MESIEKSKKEAGFTLLETMIALAVLAIALLGLAQLFALTVYQNGYARHSTMGIGVARGKLEELRNLYNAELESGAPSADLTPGPHGPETVTLTAPTYAAQGNWQLLVSWTVTAGAGNQKTVAVTAAPQNSNRLNTKTVTVTSHFAP